MEAVVVLLKRLMIEEDGYTEDDASNLINKHSDIIMHGIMKGNFYLRATVMALEMKESDALE